MSLSQWTLVYEHTHQDGRVEATGMPKEELHKQTHKYQPTNHSSASDAVSWDMLWHSAQIKNMDAQPNKEHHKPNIPASIVERKGTWPTTVCKGNKL
jgi:hypothetical protein